MIRWLQKQDGSRVLQYAEACRDMWHDVPTEVEQLPYLTAEEFVGEMTRINAKPEPRKAREWLIGFNRSTADGRPIVYHEIDEPHGAGWAEYNWHKVREVPCEHESDGNLYTSIPPKYRCKKCHAWYLTTEKPEPRKPREFVIYMNEEYVHGWTVKHFERSSRADDPDPRYFRVREVLDEW